MNPDPPLTADTTPRAERDWPCDLPDPHPPHEASAYDDLGILIGYTEQCHGGTEASADHSDTEALAARCSRCGGKAGQHGFVHVRHGNGGGHNEPCPLTPSEELRRG
jgi:hypothetical protein